MASWFMEGLVHRLINPNDPVARKFLESATLYLVPNINPDGSFRGHLRTNAFGANLNRGTPALLTKERKEKKYPK